MSKDMQEKAREALNAKKEHEDETEGHGRDAQQTPDKGMQPTFREDQPPSGAFDAEGHKPVVERTRKAR